MKILIPILIFIVFQATPSIAKECLAVKNSECFQVVVPISKTDPNTFLLNYRVVKSSNEEAPFLFLLQGGPLDLAYWRRKPLEPFLKYFNIVSIEYRGTGDSNIPYESSTEMFNTSQIAEDIEYIKKHVSPTQKIFIYAHSWGVFLALEYARKFPSSLNSMSLISGRADYFWAAAQIIQHVDVQYESSLEISLEDFSQKEEALRKFQELKELAMQSKIKYSHPDRPDVGELVMNFEDIAFLLIRYADVNGGEEFLEGVNGLIEGKDYVLKWFYKKIKENQAYSKVNSVFSCGEVVPYLLQSGEISRKQKNKIIRYKEKHCSHVEGPAQLVKTSVKKISVPAFIVFAQNDSIIPLLERDFDFAKSMPKSKLLVLDSGGHNIEHDSRVIKGSLNWFLQKKEATNEFNN